MITLAPLAVLRDLSKDVQMFSEKNGKILSLSHQLSIELEGEAEGFAVVGVEVGAGTQFFDDAVVEFREFVAVEEAGEEGACKATVAAQKLSAECREIFNAVMLVPSALRNFGIITELLADVFPHHEREPPVVLVSCHFGEAVMHAES